MVQCSNVRHPIVLIYNLKQSLFVVRLSVLSILDIDTSDYHCMGYRIISSNLHAFSFHIWYKMPKIAWITTKRQSLTFRHVNVNPYVFVALNVAHHHSPRVPRCIRQRGRVLHQHKGSWWNGRSATVLQYYSTVVFCHPALCQNSF